MSLVETEEDVARTEDQDHLNALHRLPVCAGVESGEGGALAVPYRIGEAMGMNKSNVTLGSGEQSLGVRGS